MEMAPVVVEVVFEADLEDQEVVEIETDMTIEEIIVMEATRTMVAGMTDGLSNQHKKLLLLFQVQSVE